jgi:ubiquinone/menaquinone biosynthesis C-methylase UbiE
VIEPTPGLLASLRRRVKTLFIPGSGRDRDQQPDRVVGSLGLKPGQRVADIGSGSGYFTFRLEAAVSPNGRVYAVDTDPDMLFLVQQRASADGASVTPTLTADGTLNLPEPVDLLFLSHSYHHLTSPPDYLATAANQLADGGRVAIVEGRPASRLFSRVFGHATDPAVVRSEMTSAGYRLLNSYDFLRHDSFQVFGRHGRT